MMVLVDLLFCFGTPLSSAEDCFCCRNRLGCSWFGGVTVGKGSFVRIGGLFCNFGDIPAVGSYGLAVGSY